MCIQQEGLKIAFEYRYKSSITHEDCVFSQQKLGFRNEDANARTYHMGRIRRKIIS